MNNKSGFTLLEILIALFIFTILSLMLTSALHNMINFQAGVEAKAERLRNLQMALLVMSRDVEQVVNRSVMNTHGTKEVAFIGSHDSFTFTHAGFANLTSHTPQSSLQRTTYVWEDHSLKRMTWAALDQAPGSIMHSRTLLLKVKDAHFQYLDKEGHFHDQWPLVEQPNQSLPRAVRIELTLSTWGILSQLYVISAQTHNIPSPSA